MQTSTAKQGVPPLNESEAQKIIKQLYTRLVESGQWTMLSKQLRTNLDATGWEDQLRSHARETARTMNPLSVMALSQAISGHAKTTIPQHIKDDLTKQIREIIEKQVETEA